MCCKHFVGQIMFTEKTQVSSIQHDTRSSGGASSVDNMESYVIINDRDRESFFLLQTCCHSCNHGYFLKCICNAKKSLTIL